MIAAGGAVLVGSLRRIRDANRTETWFTCMWMSGLVGLGVLALFAGAFGAVAQDGKPLPSAVTLVVMLLTMTTIAGFGVAGMWTKSVEFREQRQLARELRTPAPRYLLGPWGVGMLIVAVGFVLILVVAFVGSEILDARLQGVSTHEADQTTDVFVDAIMGFTYALVPVAILAGCWRAVQRWREGRAYVHAMSYRLD
jgi:hypothetical protein